MNTASTEHADVIRRHIKRTLPVKLHRSGDLHDALAAFCRSGKPEPKPIGYAFRKVQGRPVGSNVLRREELDRTGIVRWLVQICE